MVQASTMPLSAAARPRRVVVSRDMPPPQHGSLVVPVSGLAEVPELGRAVVASAYAVVPVFGRVVVPVDGRLVVQTAKSLAMRSSSTPAAGRGRGMVNEVTATGVRVGGSGWASEFTSSADPRRIGNVPARTSTGAGCASSDGLTEETISDEPGP